MKTQKLINILKKFSTAKKNEYIEIGFKVAVELKSGTMARFFNSIEQARGATNDILSGVVGGKSDFIQIFEEVYVRKEEILGFGIV